MAPFHVGASLIDWIATHFHELFFPDKVPELARFYVFWMGVYLGSNILWDWGTKRTPPFHLAKLQSKGGVLHNSSTFTSSFLLVMGLFDEETRKLAGDTFIPIILAAGSGLLITIGELCPYKLESDGGKPPVEDHPSAG